MPSSQVITDPGCSILTFTLRWLRWPGNSTLLIGLGAEDAIWWWILKRSKQPLQSKAMPLGYMLSKMHLIMPLSLSARFSHSFPLCPSVEHFVLGAAYLSRSSVCLDVLSFVIWELAFVFAQMRSGLNNTVTFLHMLLYVFIYSLN